MKLQNPFSPESREWFRDCWECWKCGQNGQGRGGLELHHITGRDSNSTLNGAILCKYCHENILHTNEEERWLTLKTVQYLYGKGYQIQPRDVAHLMIHPYLIGPELKNWSQLETKKTA